MTSQHPPEVTAEGVVQGARAIAQQAPLGWLMTVGPDGRVDARVMQPFPVADDLVLWFGTSPTSRKAADVARSPVATAGFQSVDGSGYASFVGPVECVDDPTTRSRLWRPEWTAYFPDGPDHGYTILRLVPDRIEVLDFAHEIAPPPYGAVAAVVRRDDPDAPWHLG